MFEINFETVINFFWFKSNFKIVQLDLRFQIQMYFQEVEVLGKCVIEKWLERKYEWKIPLEWMDVDKKENEYKV